MRSKNITEVLTALNLEIQLSCGGGCGIGVKVINAAEYSARLRAARYVTRVYTRDYVPFFSKRFVGDSVFDIVSIFVAGSVIGYASNYSACSAPI